MASLSLDWIGDLNFKNSDGSPAIELRSSSPGYTSPPNALAYALMGCMAMDIVETLRRGRYTMIRMTTVFHGERAPHAPKRWLKMALRFDLATDAPPHAIERAIDMSREKYCSVWHTIKPDVELTTTYTVDPA